MLNIGKAAMEGGGGGGWKKTSLGIDSSLMLEQKKGCSKKSSRPEVLCSIVCLLNEAMKKRRFMFNLRTS